MKTASQFAILSLLFCILNPGQGLSQDSTAVYRDNARAKQLKELNSQFKQLQSTNKNSQALEVLQRYGQINAARLQEIRVREVGELESTFKKNSRDRQTELAAIRKETGSLQNEIGALEASKQSLTTRTFLFFAILSGLIILILIIRKRVLRQITTRFEDAELLKARLEETLNKSHSGEQQRLQLTRQVTEINMDLLQHSLHFEKIAEDKQHSENKVVRQLLSDISQSQRILSAHPDAADEGTSGKTNLNFLIRDVARLSYEEFCHLNPEFNCDLTLDLEEILPDVDVQAFQLRKALFCLISNALISLHLKRMDAPKGYQPKLTVTSRKLPRFVQIRIRDNGAGIPALLLQNDSTLNTTISENEQLMALGIQEAKRVIIQMHKGELVFESEPGSQSDAIIRFQIHALQ